MENKKVAIVTGSGAGIGKAIALRLAADGYAVVVNDLREEYANAVAEEIRMIGVPALVAIGDVADKANVDAIVAKTINEWGRIDVMVNNAGVCPIRTLNEVTVEGLERTFHINVTSQLLFSQAVAPYMAKQGGGKIINACSQSSFRQSAVNLEYATSKWAARGLVRCLATSLAQFNITVNGYCPGTVWSEMQDQIAEKVGGIVGIPAAAYKEKTIKDIPLGRHQKAEDIAAFVSFLASPGADNITGQCILINGGQVMN